MLCKVMLQVAILAGCVMPAGWAQARSVNATAPASGSYLGIWIREIDEALAKELRLPEGSGVEVTLVRAGSPADLAGLKPGDVIAEYAGQKVDGIEQFSRLVRETPSGKPVKLRIVRNGTSQFLTAKIETISAAERPGPITVRRVNPAPQVERQDVPRSLMTWRNPALGIDAEPLFGQLAAYFGVAEGVLVRAVAAGSPAERAGLKAGDVITRVAKQSVATPPEITARVRAAAVSSVPVVVMRDRKEITLTITLE